MKNAPFDPGFTNRADGRLRRAINRDGTFNVRRRGASWRDSHPYMQLINMSWPAFVAFSCACYVVINTGFAAIYWLIGPAQLSGALAPTAGETFMNVFFFSAQTLTTVGYGGIVPHGLAANVVSAIEAMCGVFGFALGTGLLFGRFSRPSARIAFSEQALIAPYQDGFSLQFRILNRRSNTIIEVDATVLLAWVEPSAGGSKIRYAQLELERAHVSFFPLSWTIVHPITPASPLHGKTAADLEREQVEVMILVQGYDDTFSQTVHARYSYRASEIVWGARFVPAFETAPDGILDLHIDRISDHRREMIS